MSTKKLVAAIAEIARLKSELAAQSAAFIVSNDQMDETRALVERENGDLKRALSRTRGKINDETTSA